jgi:hypothetical protein
MQGFSQREEVSQLLLPKDGSSVAMGDAELGSLNAG